jgi:HTH-type transcriptional regulator/antitoxin HipB
MRTARITGSKALGSILREARTRQGLTQRELADLLEVSQRYVVELEQGKSVKSFERLFAFMREVDLKIYGELGELNDEARS